MTLSAAEKRILIARIEQRLFRMGIDNAAVSEQGDALWVGFNIQFGATVPIEAFEAQPRVDAIESVDAVLRHVLSQLVAQGRMTVDRALIDLAHKVTS